MTLKVLAGYVEDSDLIHPWGYGVGVKAGSSVAVGNGVSVAVGVSVGTRVSLGIGLSVAVGSGVCVWVALGRAVGIGVSDGVGVSVGIGVSDGVRVAVGKGGACEAVAGTGVVLAVGGTRLGVRVGVKLGVRVAGTAVLVGVREGMGGTAVRVGVRVAGTDVRVEVGGRCVRVAVAGRVRVGNAVPVAVKVAVRDVVAELVGGIIGVVLWVTVPVEWGTTVGVEDVGVEDVGVEDVAVPDVSAPVGLKSGVFVIVAAPATVELAEIRRVGLAPSPVTGTPSTVGSRWCVAVALGLGAAAALSTTKVAGGACAKGWAVSVGLDVAGADGEAVGDTKTASLLETDVAAKRSASSGPPVMAANNTRLTTRNR
jgi:hypothetical protein